MAGMSVNTGLISGIDYATMIDQLMQVEANPQTLLNKQLSATKADAAAYRAVNTRFEALRTAAAALGNDATWNAAKATSSSSTVAASAGAGAAAGSVTFTVDTLAAAHSQRSNATFTVPAGQTAKDVDFGATSLTVSVNGAAMPAIDLDTDGSGTTDLTEAAAAINARTDLGLTANLVQVAPNTYRLQVATKTSGAAGKFELGGGAGFTTLTEAADAELVIGSGPGSFSVVSTTNTFAGLLPDSSITVSKAGETATVTVARDPDAVAGKVQALVDTANGLLDSVTSYTDTKSETALLKGDSTLRDLAGRILDIVSNAVGGTSASVAGLQLTRDGKFTFDKAKFTAKLASDPAVVRDLFSKTNLVSTGIDGVAGNADDVTAPVGIAAQLEALAKSASDTTTGSLVLLATSQDTLARDLTDRIANWDIRLELRRATVTAQFTAMEKALGTMQNQASWLSSQIAGLPSWSQSAKS